MCLLDHQTYSDFDVFLAVKGVYPLLINNRLYQYFKDHIQSGRLTWSHKPNHNQLSNFLDTIRGMDIDRYDLFLKLDDDDYIGPRFMEEVVARYDRDAGENRFSDTPSMFIWGNNLEQIGPFSLQYRTKHAGGCGSVLTRRVIDLLFEYEATPAEDRHKALEEKYPGLQFKLPENQVGFREDNLMWWIAEYVGRIINFHDSAEGMINGDVFMVRRYGPSVLRQRSTELFTEFRECNCLVRPGDEYAMHTVMIPWAGAYRQFFVWRGVVYSVEGERYGVVRGGTITTPEIDWADGRRALKYSRDTGMGVLMPDKEDKKGE